MHKLTVCFSALAVLALLVTARWLEPAQNGYGTHQQLGLPVCTWRALWGIPCPACGMTTSWSLMMRGQWQAAMEANLGGSLLAIIALAYLAAVCYCLAGGRAWTRQQRTLTLAVSLLGAMAVAIAQWAFRLAE